MGGPGGSWGRSGDHFGPRGCPRGVPGTPGAEKVMKSLSFPRLFPIFRVPQNHTFAFFFDSCSVFWGICSGRGFRRPVGRICRGFWDAFRIVFCGFVKDVGRGSVLRTTLFVVCFTIFFEYHIDLFENKVKIN